VTAALSLSVAVVTVVELGMAGIIGLGVAALAAFVLGVDAQRRVRGLWAPVVAVAAAIGELAVLVVATAH
jgi:hypothetical protein